METMKKVLQENKLILKEGAVIERLRRSNAVTLHPTLGNAPLIYEECGRQALRDIYNSYIVIAEKADIPFLMCTPTWRADYARVSESGIDTNINRDAVMFLKEIRKSHTGFSRTMYIGGLIGCKNDCYKPEQGLSVTESASYHSWQIQQLAKGGVDLIIAETLPNSNEALGMATCLASAGVPYIISFVIARNGLILDGTKLIDAIHTIDEGVDNQPLGYSINCSHPSFLCPEKQPPGLFTRLIAYSGNASSLDHCELDGSDQLKADNVQDWGEQMLNLNRTYGVTILGGCCGTGVEHIRYLVEN